MFYIHILQIHKKICLFSIAFDFFYVYFCLMRNSLLLVFLR